MTKFTLEVNAHDICYGFDELSYPEAMKICEHIYSKRHEIAKFINHIAQEKIAESYPHVKLPPDPFELMFLDG